VKVAVLGWYGHGNFGDELILEGLKKLFKGWTIQPYSNDDTSKYPQMDFDAINRCDLFVFGGGELIRQTCLFMQTPSIFNRHQPSLLNSFYCRTPFSKYSWAHKIKIPKIILGCGINAKSPEELSHWVIDGLKQFSYIGLRDNTAVKLLRACPQLKNKVGLFYDLAFAIDVERINCPHKNQAVVIPTDRSLLGDIGLQQINVVDKSRPWLTEKLKPYDKAVFLSFGQQDNDDYETCKRLASCSSYGEVYHPDQLTLRNVMDLISESAFVVPYRLHGLILSFMLGANHEFYPYHWKLQRVHDTIAGLQPEKIRATQQARFKEVIEKLT
jgi:polysaccharide pyruvyl transferase WcaK-like protein